MAEDYILISQGLFAHRAEKSQNGDFQSVRGIQEWEHRVLNFALGTPTLTHGGHWAAWAEPMIPGHGANIPTWDVTQLNPCVFSLLWPSNMPGISPLKKAWAALDPNYGNIPLIFKSPFPIKFKLELCIFAFPPDNIVFCNMKLDWGERNNCWVVWISIITLKEAMVTQLTLH